MCIPLLLAIRGMKGTYGGVSRGSARDVRGEVGREVFLAMDGHATVDPVAEAAAVSRKLLLQVSVIEDHVKRRRTL